jgi:peptidyl-prolyl cis-trans isomerase B (cyclophilin B)
LSKYTISEFANLYIITEKMAHALIETAYGTLKVSFYEADAPGTVKNFIDLAQKGFYDGLSFHRVLPGFVVQGGCPLGTGTGGPGYKIRCELDGNNQFHERGVLSMAHAGPNTGGSQFFIVLDRASTAHLDRRHTCFGKVTENVDIIDSIKQGDKMIKITIVED